MPESDKNNPSQVAIVISTHYTKWYQGQMRSIQHTDKVRGDLALQLVHEASKRGYHVIVIDTYSAKTFVKHLKQVENVYLSRGKNYRRSPAKRLGIKKAAKLPGIQAIVLTEPEKVSLITDCLPQIVEPLLKGNADIVVPKREGTLFKKTYPSYMRESEMEGNSFYNEALRAYGLLSTEIDDFDLFFGPRAFRNTSSLRALFMRKYLINASNLSFPGDFFDTEEYSNTLYFPIVLALRKKLNVKSITVPFQYPKTQKENEEKGAPELFLQKRKAQRLALLVELLHFFSYLSQNKNSRVRKAL